MTRLGGFALPPLTDKQSMCLSDHRGQQSPFSRTAHLNSCICRSTHRKRSGGLQPCYIEILEHSRIPPQRLLCRWFLSLVLHHLDLSSCVRGCFSGDFLLYHTPAKHQTTSARHCVCPRRGHSPS